MKNTFAKIISIFLCVGILMCALASCESQPIKSEDDALALVGCVGEYDITYEELYFLVHSYSDQLDAIYGEDAATSNERITVEENGEEKEVVLSEYYLDELERLVYDNIVSNYTVLTLAEDAGLSLESEEIQKNVQISLDAYIETDFLGKRSNYKKWLHEEGITDNYVRFTLGVDLLYSELANEYLKTGIISDDNDFIEEYIKTEFVRTWHIMILNEDGADENYERAKEALDKIKSGTTMYDMIGSTYNEDYKLTTLDGYYFTKGIMDEAYESAAYALEVNEVSDIVASVGEDSAGNKVDCYYIIQRLEVEDAYVKKHFDELKDSYYVSVIYDMVDELKSSLEFVPNDYCRSLNFLALEAPNTTDPVIVLAVGSVIFGAIAIFAAVVIVAKMKKNKEEKIRLAIEAKKKGKE